MSKPVSAALKRRAPLLCAALLLSSLPFAFALDRLWLSDRVLRGVWLGNRCLFGLDAREVEQALQELKTELATQRRTVRIKDRVFFIRLERIGFTLDVPATVSAALKAGRTGALSHDFRFWLERLFGPMQLLPKVSVDPERLRSELVRIQADAVDNPPSNGSVRFVQGKLVSKLPESGYRIDARAAAAMLVGAAAAFQNRTLEFTPQRAAPSLTPRAVERAAARARRIGKGGITLVTKEGELSLSFTERELQEALQSRAAPGGRDELLLFFDQEHLENKLESLRGKLDAEPKNAEFFVDGKDRISIVPSKPGTEVATAEVSEALLQAAYAPLRIGELPVRHDVEPELSTLKAKALAITKLVASFTTRHPCCQQRVENIHRIADMIDNVLVLPGETFSVNKHVGPRSKENGFAEAPSIEFGEMVDSVGGGVSQFATTLFNAIFYAGYDVIQRQPHSYWFPRYPMGIEATLSYPTPDLIFRNDTESGLLIKTHYTNTSITVKLYGDTQDRTVKAQVSPRQEIVEPEVELIADDSIAPDEEKVVEKGSIGWSIQVKRVLTFRDGRQKEESRKVIYQPRPKRIAVHSCRIPEGEPDYTGEPCPEPEDAELEGEPDASAGPGEEHNETRPTIAAEESAPH